MNEQMRKYQHHNVNGQDTEKPVLQWYDYGWNDTRHHDMKWAMYSIVETAWAWKSMENEMPEKSTNGVYTVCTCTFEI